MENMSGISEAPGLDRNMEVSSLFLQSNACATAPMAEFRIGDAAFERVWMLSVESVLRVRTTSMTSRSLGVEEITLAFMFSVFGIVWNE